MADAAYRACPKCGCRSVLWTGQSLGHCRNCDGPFPRGMGFEINVLHTEDCSEWMVRAEAPDGTVILTKTFEDREAARAFSHRVAQRIAAMVEHVERGPPALAHQRLREWMLHLALETEGTN